MRPFISLIFLTGIKLYQAASLLLGLRSPCRFYPSCSSYASEAVRRQGPFKGAVMTASRLFRCHPWNPGGIDLPYMESK